MHVARITQLAQQGSLRSWQLADFLKTLVVFPPVQQPAVLYAGLRRKLMMKSYISLQTLVVHEPLFFSFHSRQKCWISKSYNVGTARKLHSHNDAFHEKDNNLNFANNFSQQ